MSTVTTSEGKKSSYLREVQGELKKVTWTSKEELIFCTKTVVIATFIFGFSVYFVDLTIHGSLDFLGSLVRKVFG
jgi:preprotein translocase subunit SecE